MKVYISQPYRCVSKAEYDFEYKRMSQTIINHGHTPIVPVFDYSPFILSAKTKRTLSDILTKMLPACLTVALLLEYHRLAGEA